MRPLWKILYYMPMFAGWFVSFLAMAFLAFVFMEGRGRDREVIPLLVFPAMLPAMIGFAVPMMILVYKSWASIQDGKPRTSPEMAVALLFVPVFNLYWMFQAYWGWAKDFNEYAKTRNLRVSRAPEGLALTYCILLLVSCIPFIGAPIALLNQLVLLALVWCSIDSINSLIAARKPAIEVKSNAATSNAATDWAPVVQ